MVAENGIIITDSIHQINDQFTFGNSADHIALNGIAAVDKQNIGSD